jgi:hypothetical protein
MMNRNQLFASIEAVRLGRDDVVCLPDLSRRLTQRRIP